MQQRTAILIASLQSLAPTGCTAIEFGFDSDWVTFEYG